MRTRRLDFARSPFRDERPVYLLAGLAFLAAAVLLAENIHLYRDFHFQSEGTGQQIEFLEKRRSTASREAEESRTALNNFKVSALAQESRGLLQIIGERHFSWTGLLTRLERTLPPEVRVTRLSPHFEETGETTLSIGLLGKDSDSVVKTIAAFSHDPEFDSVALHGESSPEKGVPEGHTFEVTVRYRPGARS
jgi:Tfp pilus assembly protein PilN